MTDLLDQLVQSSIYHHDTMVLLREIEKQPLSLTKTGRLQRAEITKLAQLFKRDIYHRDEHGAIMFQITTEDEVQHLLCLRALAKIMHLTYQRKGKVYLSKNGRGFIENISPGVQLTHLFLTFVNQLSWEYLHPTIGNRQSVSKVLQKNARPIFQYLLQAAAPVNMRMFSDHLAEYFHLSGLEEPYSEAGDLYRWVRSSIDHTLIRELEFFGIVTTQKVKKDLIFEDIVDFTVTEGGKILLSRVFDTRWGY